MYHISLNSCKETTICIQKWSKMFNSDIPTSDYKKMKINKLSFQCCTLTSIQSLQVKILHRITVHSRSRFNMELIRSPNCNIRNEIGTVHHRFLNKLNNCS